MFTGAFGLPLQTSANTNSSESEVFPAASKVVTITKYYGLNQSIESTYYYNVGGWSGTLKLQSYQSTGDGYIAHYSGTVVCSGNCAMSKVADSK